MLNKNTVVIDLDRYDELMNELRKAKDYINTLEDKLILDADSFCIEQEYSSTDNSNLVLKIDRRAIRSIVDRIGGYSVDCKYSREMAIVGKYEIEITKEEA